MATLIGDAHAAHDFNKDNEFIKTGYRINFCTVGRILKSLFMIHNESVNVWTHLLGVLLFAYLFWHSLLILGYTPDKSEISDAFNSTRLQEWRAFLEGKFEVSKSSYYEVEAMAKQYSAELEANINALYLELHLEASDLGNAIKADAIQSLYDLKEQIYELLHSLEYVERWPMMVFILSAIFCLGCSVICHLFSAHSESVHSAVARLDYAGISILIAGSYFPTVYYIFYCNTTAIWIYLSGISIFSVMVFILAMAPFFQKSKYRTLRGVSFLALGLLGLIPFSHMILLPNISHFTEAIVWFLLMGLSYVVGVGFYIIRIPERFYPGKFDLIGSSHNIWHCFVLLAVVSHYVGSRWSYYLRQQTTCEI